MHHRAWYFISALIVIAVFISPFTYCRRYFTFRSATVLAICALFCDLHCAVVELIWLFRADLSCDLWCVLGWTSAVVGLALSAAVGRAPTCCFWRHSSASAVHSGAMEQDGISLRCNAALARRSSLVRVTVTSLACVPTM